MEAIIKFFSNDALLQAVIIGGSGIIGVLLGLLINRLFLKHDKKSISQKVIATIESDIYAKLQLLDFLSSETSQCYHRMQRIEHGDPFAVPFEESYRSWETLNSNVFQRIDTSGIISTYGIHMQRVYEFYDMLDEIRVNHIPSVLVEKYDPNVGYNVPTLLQTLRTSTSNQQEMRNNLDVWFDHKNAENRLEKISKKAGRIQESFSWTNMFFGGILYGVLICTLISALIFITESHSRPPHDNLNESTTTDFSCALIE